MGVLLAHPDASVACITGEGSIQMNIQELSTCKQYQLPVKIINLNNRYLGMVRQWQEIEYGSRYSQSYMDAGKYKDRLVFLDFITDQTENVWPMVQGGKGLTEMILGAEDL
jgi:acetolactate synthase-1/2/3 large subunit